MKLVGVDIGKDKRQGYEDIAETVAAVASVKVSGREVRQKKGKICFSSANKRVSCLQNGLSIQYLNQIANYCSVALHINSQVLYYKFTSHVYCSWQCQRVSV